jgi:hypothetical protein
MSEQSETELCINEPGKNELNKSLQQILLDVIWHEGSTVLEQCGFDAKGINIYRRNLLANAQRALTISFPTVFELLDSDIGEDLVYQFLRKSPPDQGDWALWGENFSHFLETTKIAMIYPYISDCSTLDWHIHCALNGRDQTLVQTSLQVLGESEPKHIFIEFNQNVRVLKTAFPLEDIFYAHHHEDEQQRKMAMNNAKQALSVKPLEQFVMVYRPEYQPKVTTLTINEGRFINDLLAGKSLEQALNAVNHDYEFSFEQWLISAIERNLIYYFKEK